MKSRTLSEIYGRKFPTPKVLGSDMTFSALPLLFENIQPTLAISEVRELDDDYGSGTLIQRIGRRLALDKYL